MIGRPPPALNPRQRYILSLICRGFHDKEIALELAISYASVRQSVERIYHRLDVHSRVQAIATAQQLGITDIDR